jgi:hypothetical protein
MTIASHCLSLIREHGPLTAEQLGAACLEAGVTASRTPDRSVGSALSWNQDGRAFRVGDRFHAVTELLEGRWLTFHPPVDGQPGAEQIDVDLACLARVVRQEGLPLANGGVVRSPPYSFSKWIGPEGWLPDGEILGLRVMGGIAALRAVVIDEAAEQRGERLIELLDGGNRYPGYGYSHRHKVAGQGLLALLAEHDDLLREPVPPLSSLLPAPPQEPRQSSWDAQLPFGSTVHIHLSPELYGHLDQVARATGARLDHWLTDQLTWLADSPLVYGVLRALELAELGRGGRYVDDRPDTGRNYGLDDHEDPAWNASPSVLPFARPRGGDLGAS